MSNERYRLYMSGAPAYTAADKPPVPAKNSTNVKCRGFIKLAMISLRSDQPRAPLTSDESDLSKNETILVSEHGTAELGAAHERTCPANARKTSKHRRSPN